MTDNKIKTTVTKEIRKSVGYGFSDKRNITMIAIITDGKLNKVEITANPSVENKIGFTLSDDAFELMKLFAPAVQEFYKEIEKEIGKVR